MLRRQCKQTRIFVVVGVAFDKNNDRQRIKVWFFLIFSFLPFTHRNVCDAEWKSRGWNDPFRLHWMWISREWKSQPEKWLDEGQSFEVKTKISEFMLESSGSKTQVLTVYVHISQSFIKPRCSLHVKIIIKFHLDETKWELWAHRVSLWQRRRQAVCCPSRVHLWKSQKLKWMKPSKSVQDNERCLSSPSSSFICLIWQRWLLMHTYGRCALCG